MPSVKCVCHSYHEVVNLVLSERLFYVKQKQWLVHQNYKNYLYHFDRSLGPLRSWLLDVDRVDMLLDVDCEAEEDLWPPCGNLFSCISIYTLWLFCNSSVFSWQSSSLWLRVVWLLFWFSLYPSRLLCAWSSLSTLPCSLCSVITES